MKRNKRKFFGDSDVLTNILICASRAPFMFPLNFLSQISDNHIVQTMWSNGNIKLKNDFRAPFSC